MQIPRPWLPPRHPTSVPVTPDSRFPRRRSRGIGVQHGTSGSRASPHARQSLSCPLFLGRSRLLRSHGHVALPARGVPGSTPGPGDAPALGQPVGCWMPAQSGAPYSSWAHVLPGSSALGRRASTIHWPSLPAPLFSLPQAFIQTVSPGVLPILYARHPMLAISLLSPPETLSLFPFLAQDQQA